MPEKIAEGWVKIMPIFLSRNWQTDNPLTPTLSPSDGEREKSAPTFRRSVDIMQRHDKLTFTLSPSDGKRDGVRGAFN